MRELQTVAANIFSDSNSAYGPFDDPVRLANRHCPE